jgi:hypothetical protein
MFREIAVVAWLILGLVGSANSQTPAGGLLSDRALRDAYLYGSYAHTGYEYQLAITPMLGCDQVQDVWKQWAALHRTFALQNVAKVQNVRGFAFDFPIELREKLWTMREPSDRSGFIQYANGRCGLAQLLSRTPSRLPPIEAIVTRLRNAVQRNAIPHPESPEFRRAILLDSIDSTEAVARLPAEVDINGRTLDGATVLIRAIYGGGASTVAAVLRRGANPSLCGPQMCPLTAAVHQRENAAAMVRLLLDAGADPNQFDAALQTFLALGVAAMERRLDLMRTLLDAGANASGVAGALPPIVLAAEAGSREAMAMLIQRGADLVWKEGPLAAAPYFAAQQHPGLAQWLEPQIVAASIRGGRLDWTGWIEQGGRRQAIDGRDIVLKREPFRFVFRLATPEEGIAVQAMDAAVLHKQVRAGGTEAAMARGVATAGAEEESDTSFFVGRAQDPSAVYHAWSPVPQAPRLKRGVVQGEWVREVSSIHTIEVDGTPETKPVDMARSPHAVIYLAVATQIMLSSMEARLHRPQLVRLVFQ